MNITATELIDRCKKRADIGTVADATIYDWINGSIAELYRLIAHTNPDFYVTSSDIAVRSGTSEYSLPSDFWFGFGVDVQLEDSTWANMRPFRWGDRNQLPHATDRRAARYQFNGSQIRFRPSVSWTSTVRVWYVPTPPQMATGTDTWDTLAGFDEFVILSVAVKYCAKTEQDPSTFAAQLGALKNEIIGQVQTRDRAEPYYVRDVYRERDYTPTYDNP